MIPGPMALLAATRTAAPSCRRPAALIKGDVMRTPMTALLSLACVGLVLTTASRAQNPTTPPTFDRVYS